MATPRSAGCGTRTRDHVALAVLCVLCTRAAAQCNAGAWLPGPPPPGTNGSILAMLPWDPDGAGASAPRLVIGGRFDLAGVPAGGLATWDGSAWSAFADVGAGQRVQSLCEFNGDLIVGGNFSSIGSVAASNIARYNGSSWSAMGNELGGLHYVYALAVYNGQLYAGGSFPAGIARWNGTAWTSIGISVGGGSSITSVNALAVYNNQLVIAGDFTTNNGNPAGPGIISYDGSAVHNLGWGIGGRVNALCVQGTDLYAGGGFSTADGSSAHDVARWDGAAWHPLGSGITGGYYVETLTFYAGKLVATGPFSTAGGAPANGIATWDGSAWQVPAEFGSSSYDAAAIYNGELYVGNLLRWDGTTVRPVGQGFDAPVACTALHGGDLYIGGTFVQADQTPANKVARWNGAGSDALGNGLGVGRSETVYALQSYAGDLYAAGTITKAEGAPANKIARWDGAAWQPVGSGLTAGAGTATVYAMATFNNELIAAGSFTAAGGSAAANIGAWNGSSWHALGGGLSPAVHALAVYNGELYAAGLMPGLNNIRRWNGTSWQAVGSGVTGSGGFGHTGQVNALLPWDGKLYVGGYIDFASGTPVSGLATWNGASWASGGTFDDRPVYALADYRGDLIVGGFFGNAGGTPVANIARYNGVTWTALGAGVYDQATALGVHGEDLFVTGVAQAGNEVSWGLARWEDLVAPAIVTQPFDTATCPGGTAGFTVEASGTFLNYQWQKDSVDLSDDNRISGAHSAQLSITGATTDDAGVYSCIVSNDCDTAQSAGALLGVCLADYNCDGFVTGDDFDAFSYDFFWGLPNADVNHDGFVNGDDFDEFSAHFDAGC